MNRLIINHLKHQQILRVNNNNQPRMRAALKQNCCKDVADVKPSKNICTLKFFLIIWQEYTTQSKLFSAENMNTV